MRNAHSLKSSSRTVGALKLGSTAENFEQSVPTLQPDEIGDTIRRLGALFPELCSALSEQGFSIPEQSDFSDS
ncbi:MAG: Hpt domain-containing protein [Chitinispirillaceae bacterium]|nr:Hpt domain-containing protein [Chitinispirillaceae bacterium]